MTFNFSLLHVLNPSFNNFSLLQLQELMDFSLLFSPLLLRVTLIKLLLHLNMPSFPSQLYLLFFPFFQLLNELSLDLLICFLLVDHSFLMDDLFARSLLRWCFREVEHDPLVSVIVVIIIRVEYFFESFLLG